MNNKPYAGISHGLSPQALNKAMLEAVDFVDAKGWDAPPTLFGLVPTALIRLAHDALDDAPLTLVVQELPSELTPESEELGAYISRVTWPDGVVGAILARQRIDTTQASPIILRGTPRQYGTTDTAATAAIRIGYAGTRSS